MDFDRRHFLRLSAAAAAAGAAALPVRAAPTAPPIGTLGLDATHFGLRPGSPDDQTRALQNAIDAAARAQAPLALPPGIYRAGNLRLPAGTQLLGVRGATQLVLTEGPALLAAKGADHITLSGLVLMAASVRSATSAVSFSWRVAAPCASSNARSSAAVAMASAASRSTAR